MDGSSVTEARDSLKKIQDKRAKFVALAESRTVNAIRAIRVIGKLGNKSAYEFDDSDVTKIIKALNHEIDALKRRLCQTTAKAKVEFRL